jgi:hypothetical protein
LRRGAEGLQCRYDLTFGWSSRRAEYDPERCFGIPKHPSLTWLDLRISPGNSPYPQAMNQDGNVGDIRTCDAWSIVRKPLSSNIERWH